MLHQDNGKNLSTKEAIVVSQDCPKLLGSPVTCGSQRVNHLNAIVFLVMLVNLSIDIFLKFRNCDH